MSGIEIILLVLGVVIFIVSFLLPDKDEKNKGSFVIDQAAIKDAIAIETRDAKERFHDELEESTKYSLEKAERSLERISNEKIMAVNEFSETVLEQIHVNHKETMFLYDMLNDKQIEINQTAKLVNKTVKNSSDKIQQLEQAKPLLRELRDEIKKEDPKQESLNSRGLDQGKHIVDSNQNEILKDRFEENIDFGISNVKNGNQNEQILILHRQGKTKVEIAKQLGLGVGEVKLVIDLFQGI